MILGIGFDLVDISRIERLLERHPGRARARLFCGGEIEYCEGVSTPARSYAARFAAKEAFLKAVRTGWGRGIDWCDVEVESAAGGAPRLRLHGAARERAEALGVKNAHLSLTHTDTVAGAFLVLEG